MTYYDILEVDAHLSDDEIVTAAKKAFTKKASELYRLKNNQTISHEEFNARYSELKEAADVLTNAERRNQYDDSIFTDTGEKKGIGKKIALATGAILVAGAIAVTCFLNKDKIMNLFLAKDSDPSNRVTYEQMYDNDGGYQVTYDNQATNDQTTGSQTTVSDNDATTESTEQETETQEQEPEFNPYRVSDMGNVQDEALVKERAQVLVEELATAGVVNPVTVAPYTVEEIVPLIQYAWGVYTPETMEEIDVLHMNLLNLFISPLNTDSYLYHVVFASGNDDFNDLLTDTKPIDFASAFAEYGENGVYPLTLWMQQKREEIYASTDREEINKIFVEVGQVMADLMKGNGCTITWTEDKQEYTCTYTSEQVLANHASAMLLTIDAQLIFANHYEIRDENNKVVDAVQTQWEVYNKFHSTEEPDIVTLEEIEAWINNGCDYEWEIDSVLIDGQTFGQRIQGNMEGMAQNNYAMNSGQTLTK